MFINQFDNPTLVDSLAPFFNEGVFTVPNNLKITIFCDSLNTILYTYNCTKINVDVGSCLEIYEINPINNIGILINQKSQSLLNWVRLCYRDGDCSATISSTGKSSCTNFTSINIPSNNSKISLSKTIKVRGFDQNITQLTKNIIQKNCSLKVSHNIQVDNVTKNLVAKQLIQTTQQSKAVLEIKPILEIDSPDVICSHGCSIGSIPADSLLYMQAKGMNKQKSIELLLRSDIIPLLDQIDKMCVRKKFSQKVDELLLS